MAKHHFIAGLPRSGSTMLSGLLNQNPNFRAGMTSPLAALIRSVHAGMGPENEFSGAIDDACRLRVLRAVIDAYYCDASDNQVIFDTSRSWAAHLPMLAQLFPTCKVIACVRNPAWILDSVERLVRRRPLQHAGIFRTRTEAFSVYSRAEALLGPDRMIGLALNALSEAVYSEHAQRILLVDYETLCKTPQVALELIYKFLEEPPFSHDFNNVDHPHETFDEQVGMPGLHEVRPAVAWSPRPTVLPPDLFQRFASMAFWSDPTAAKRVHVLGSTIESREARA